MKTIQSIDKMMAILNTISQNNGKLTLSELGRQLNMALPTLHGFVGTLEKWDVLHRNSETGCFSLGNKIVQLAGYCDREQLLIQTIHPYLLALENEYDETVHFAIPDCNGIVYLDKVECTRPFRMTSMVGTRESFFQSAIGLVLAANIQGIPMTTEERKLVQNNCQERTSVLFHPDMEIYCFAVAILNLRDIPVGGISIAVPQCRYQDSLRDQILQRLSSVANELRPLI